MKQKPIRKATKRRDLSFGLSKPKSNRDPLGANSMRGYSPDLCEKLISFSGKPENSIFAFAMGLGVHESTLYSWAKTHAEFGQAMKTARKRNEAAFIEMGLKGMRGGLPQGSWQSAWIFTMKARFGWRDDGASTTDDDDNDVDFDFER